MAGVKRALLIGNGAFDDHRLRRLCAPQSDVRDLADALSNPKIGGFESVEVLMDESLVPARKAVGALCSGASPRDLVLLYYSGHGVLTPHGDLHFALRETDMDDPAALSLEAAYVRSRLKACRAERQVLILDCCHGGAYLEGKGAEGVVAVGEDTFGTGRWVLTAAAAQEFAWEGEILKQGRADAEGTPSVFTHILVEGLTTGEAAPGKEQISVSDLYGYVFDRVRRAVPANRPSMTPQKYARGAGDFAIARNPRQRLPQDLREALYSDDRFRVIGAIEHIRAIIRSDDAGLAESAKAELQRRLNPSLAYQIYRLIEEVLDETVGKTVAPPSPEPEQPSIPKKQPKPEKISRRGPGAGPAAKREAPVTSETPAPPEPGEVFRDVDAPWCPELVALPEGEFLMGSAKEEEGRFDDEGPQHRVTIGYRFAIGRYPVTFEEYDHFCEATKREKPGDADWGRGRRPVINVSWEDAQAYLAWLSEATNQPYRLPSEAEWEYACRAGATTRYAFGDAISDKVANFNGSVGKTTEVGSYRGNDWNLYDMHGNVWEWVRDCYHDSYEGAPTDGSAWEEEKCSSRVLRGGSWDDYPREVRSAVRNWIEPDFGFSFFGFRVARTF